MAPDTIGMVAFERQRDLLKEAANLRLCQEARQGQPKPDRSAFVGTLFAQALSLFNRRGPAQPVEQPLAATSELSA